MKKAKEEKIRSEVKEVIEHADRAKSELLTWLNSGSEELASKAYAIKCRVKDENSLVRKIIYKIDHDNKPNYSAKAATDIIGLRLLALNNDQLSNLVESFVNFILFCQDKGIGLVVGGRPHQAFEQIKIYKSNSNSAVYEDIHEHLISRGLQDGKGQPQIELIGATPADPYSSVHFVCRIRDPKSAKTFALEVQIRTVFEDAWAEIEHPLRYKGTAYFDEKISADHDNLKQIADLFLVGLKQNLDHSLTVAGHIQALYLKINSIFGQRVLASSIRFTPFGGHLDSKVILDSTTPIPISRSIAKEVATQIEGVLSLFSKSKFEEADVQIDHVLVSLDRIDAHYKAKYPERYDGDFKFGFYHRMEKAFLYVLKQKVRSAKPTSYIVNSDFANKALDLYLELDRDIRHSKQASLKFRLASAAKITGRAELAQSALSKANRLLSSDNTIPSDHILRITIPRQYSLSLWLRKQAIWYEGARNGEEKHLVQQQVDILRSCLKLTKSCLKEIDRVKKTSEKDVELMRLYNNFISYVWELEDLGEQVNLESAEKQYITAFLPKLDKSIQDHDVEGFTRRLSGIDSALKASILLRDSEKKQFYQQLLQEGLDVEDKAAIADREYSDDERAYFKYCLSKSFAA